MTNSISKFQVWLENKKKYLTKRQEYAETDGGKLILLGMLRCLNEIETGIKQINASELFPKQENVVYWDHFNWEKLGAWLLNKFGLPQLPLGDFQNDRWRLEQYRLYPDKVKEIKFLNSYARHRDLINEIFEQLNGVLITKEPTEVKREPTLMEKPAMIESHRGREPGMTLETKFKCAKCGKGYKYEKSCKAHEATCEGN